jgi:hypothetical protein
MDNDSMHDGKTRTLLDVTLVMHILRHRHQDGVEPSVPLLPAIHMLENG